MLPVLQDWMRIGDRFFAGKDGDWNALIVKLTCRDALVKIGDVLVDLDALSQPFACRSEECSPGMRAKGLKSCCADLEADISKSERKAIRKEVEGLAEYFKDRDPRWADGPPKMFDGTTLRRPGGRCVFGVIENGSGIRCGLQNYDRDRGGEGTPLKPITCWMFPLVFVEVDKKRQFLTALHRRVNPLLESYPLKKFPCMDGSPDRPPMYEVMRTALETFFGKDTYRKIVRAVQKHQRSA